MRVSLSVRRENLEIEMGVQGGGEENCEKRENSLFLGDKLQLILMPSGFKQMYLTCVSVSN